MIKLGKDEPVINASFSFNPGYPGIQFFIGWQQSTGLDLFCMHKTKIGEIIYTNSKIVPDGKGQFCIFKTFF